MSDPFDHEENLFQQAIDLSPAERAAFLASIADAALRVRVTRLVHAHVQPAGIFDSPAVEPASGPRRHAPPFEGAGDVIGRYRLVDRIGEGGWGVVWRAEQFEPVRRTVALKVIKVGLDTRAVIARFEVERQSLALMDHPNIARVLDAGATDAGRPFFVMELVSGPRITDYCDQRQLSTRARLQLFIDICLAIQHAHQKGVIHRDIKPSNLLVAEVDGAPVPKVIDFGIAKATQGNAAEQTQATAIAQFVGTPAYMSPEQASTGGVDLDTRSDIYSLGVLLYELLAGKLPFESHNVREAGLEAMRAIIREQEPPRPSVRLRTTEQGELTAIARRRGTEPPGLIRQARGDLDWIVMKTLAKERHRRYATAGDLADDVRRHLRHEPVEARAPGLWYRIGKYARRRRATFLTAATIVLALAVGLTMALVGFRRAVAARAEAEEITRFLANMLAAANPSTGGEKDVTVRAVLDAAATKIAAEFADRPILRARLHEVMGQTYSGLGYYDQARTQHGEALAVRARELGPDHELTLRVGLDHAEMISLVDRVPEAEKLLREILAVYDARPRSYPAADRAWACFMIGNCLAAQGRTDDAAVFDVRALTLFEQALGPWDETTLKARGNVIANYINSGEPHLARPLLDAMLAQAPVAADSATRLVFLLNAAVAETATGAHAEAEVHIREAERLASATYGDEHRLTLNARYLLGEELVRQGDVEGGLALLERTLEIQERMLGRDEFSTLEIRASVLRVRGRHGRASVDELRPPYEELLALWRDKRGFDTGYFVAVKGLVEILAAAGTERAGEVEALCRQALDGMTAARSRDVYTRAALRTMLGDALLAQGRDAEAERTLLEGHTALEALTFDVRPQLRRSAEVLVKLYRARNDAANATKWEAAAPVLP